MAQKMIGELLLPLRRYSCLCRRLQDQPGSTTKLSTNVVVPVILHNLVLVQRGFMGFHSGLLLL